MEISAELSGSCIVNQTCVKSLAFNAIDKGVLLAAKEGCFAGPEIKTYLELRYGEKSSDLFDWYCLKGRSALSRCELLNNWQRKRVLRDIDMICVFKGSKKRCFVDRSVRVTKECQRILKGMDCKPAVVYTRQRSVNPKLKTYGADDAAKDLNIPVEKDTFWTQFGEDEDKYCFLDKMKIRKRIREVEPQLIEENLSILKQAEEKALNKIMKVGNNGPLGKNEKDVLNFKKALMNKEKIRPVEIKKSAVGISKRVGGIACIVNSRIEQSMGSILKNMSLSKNLEPWKDIKGKSPKEDLNFNENLLQVSNYYGCLWESKLAEKDCIISDITTDYVKLSTKIKQGILKMREDDPSTIKEALEKGAFGKKSKKVLMKKLKNQRAEKRPSRELLRRLKLREEVPVSSSFTRMTRSQRLRLSNKIAKLVLAISENKYSNRFQEIFTEVYPDYKLKLKTYFLFSQFLSNMDEVCLSKIWSKTETLEINDLPECFYEELEKTFLLDKILESRLKSCEDSLESSAVEGCRNVLSIMKAMELNDDQLKKREHERKMKKIAEMKVINFERRQKEKKERREEEKRMRQIEREYYEDFDVENF